MSSLQAMATGVVGAAFGAGSLFPNQLIGPDLDCHVPQELSMRALMERKVVACVAYHSVTAGHAPEGTAARHLAKTVRGRKGRSSGPTTVCTTSALITHTIIASDAAILLSGAFWNESHTPLYASRRLCSCAGDQDAGLTRSAAGRGGCRSSRDVLECRGWTE